MNTVTVLNVATGETAQFPARLVNHPIFHPKNLVLVTPGTKPYVPELYKPQSPEEFEEKHPEKVARKGKKETPETGVDAEEEN